jgi:A/G-specific adenine glycosylase
MLDLGAMHCRARPRCASCPLAVHCAWAGVGAVGADPAGTAPGQTRFAGSDRQGRGRLVARLRAGPIDGADLAEAAGWPADPDRAGRVAAGLAADGLAVVGADGRWHLPAGGGPGTGFRSAAAAR